MQYTTFKRKYNFRVVHVSPGSAETSVSGGGKVNHDLVAYFLSNMYAKNNQNRLMDVRVHAKSVSFFLRDSIEGFFARYVIFEHFAYL